VAGQRRSAVRTAVVWDALHAALDARADAMARPLEVVDLGGGTGGLAVRVAELGHPVTVVDPSPDALASLERRSAESGVHDRVRGVLGDAAGLRDILGDSNVDVVLCHGVLEVLDDPSQALAAVHTVLPPGGLLSLLAVQRYAAVFARALAGHLADARLLLDDPDGHWGSGDPVLRRFTEDEVIALLTGAAFTPQTVHGVRTFTDLVPSALVDSEPDAITDLLELERSVAGRPEFRAVATQLHVVAVRD
jgi:SAM-dependent methyltransferase